MLYDCVCGECNGTFGATLTIRILKQAEMIAAIENLKISYSRTQLLNFKIPGISGDIEVKARACIEYQQDLEKHALGFWALLPNAKNQYIGPKRSA